MKPTLGDVILTEDGSHSLLHPDHGEAYHSKTGARHEAWWLNIVSSGILGKLGLDLCVLDVGLGLGYNALATIKAWDENNQSGSLYLESLEVNIELCQALATARAPWQAGWSEQERSWLNTLRPSNSGWHGEISHPQTGAILTWVITVGDAFAQDIGKKSWSFVWQDPFSPAKNPDMWSQAWFSKLYPTMEKGGILMTYSVAKSVRDALVASGFEVDKIPAEHPQKRHWLMASVPLE